MKYGNLSIDHFIPWSFVMHDELWNLTPTLANINSIKNDNLPSWEPYFRRLCYVQFVAYKAACENESLRNHIVSYANLDARLGIPLTSRDEIMFEAFSNILEDAITPIYTLAKNHGFGVVNNFAHVTSSS